MSYTHIETIELGSSQASITFSSISQDFDDLVIKSSTRSARTAQTDEFEIRPNNVSGNNTSIYLGATSGSSSFSFSSSSKIFIGSSPGASATANSFSSNTCYISNYTSSNAKRISADGASLRFGDPTNLFIFAGLWDNTSAITSLVLLSVNGQDFVSGSTFSLYGVTAGGDGTVTTA